MRTSSTVRRSETARTRSRGAVPKTSPVIRYSVPGDRAQTTYPEMPACATRVTQERCWAGNDRNQGSRSSISATDLVARLPPARSTRRRVSSLTPGAQDVFGPSEDVTARNIDDGVGPDSRTGGTSVTGTSGSSPKAVMRSQLVTDPACHPGRGSAGYQAGVDTSCGVDPGLLTLAVRLRRR